MAAELVGGSLLSGTFKVLFYTLASREVVDYLRGREPSDDLINNLKIVLLSINAVLDDAEWKQITNPYVRQWLEELEDASYVADDLLDELATHALQSKLEASGPRKKSNTSKFFNTFSIPHKSYVRDMKKRLKGILGRLETLEKRIDALELIKGVSDNLSSRLPTTSLVDESEIYGREGDKEAIIKLLLKDDVEGCNKVCVIPIVGMGGIGKTTLAQLVYNDQNVEERFDLRSWVCVSEEFDVCKVTRTVLSTVTKSHSNVYDGEDLNSLQTRLKEALTGKKFFIVLDDVWNENYENWDQLRAPLKHGAQGSKILVTTRNENVARIMHNVEPYNLGYLTDEDCWQLFVKHAFDDKDCNAYPALVSIGRKILQKCKGLALAAKTIGGLLRAKVDVAQWERILESEIWDMQDKESNILPALMLSYHYLPSPVKRCFAFCAIFPKDYEFQRQQLVSLWMAENLLPKAKGNERPEDVGGGYFNELLASSFFQRSSSVEQSWFVMHDLVHDLAKFVSRGYCFTFGNGNSDEDLMKVRHLALTSFVSLQSFGFISNAIHLRTLLPLHWYTFSFFSNEGVNDAILKLKRLRTLSLSGCEELWRLSDSIGKLKHLRFLDLSKTSIRRLPNSVTKLYNLQTLNLSSCYQLTKLPKKMHHLVNLRHLDISGCWHLVKMPRQISELKSLQTLSTFIVGKNSGTKIEELRELSNLRGLLQIKNLQNVASAGDASEAKLKDKKHLEGLDLFWNHNSDDTIQDGEVIEKLLPHTNLERLCIYGYGGASFPNWLGVYLFCNIVFINLDKCECISLPPLGQLPSLKILLIEGLRRVVSVGAEFFGNYGSSTRKAFASLELLIFTNMLAWKEWSSAGVEDGEVFSKLRTLEISGCDKLSSVEWPDSLPSLTKLEIGGIVEKVVPVLSLPRTPALRELTLSVGEKIRLDKLPETVESISIVAKNAIGYLVEAFKKDQACSLKKLRIRGGCSEIPFPVGCLPATLTELTIDNCERLKFQIMHQRPLNTSSIQKFRMHCCSCSLAFFPLDVFPNLIQLDISFCESLESVGVSSEGDREVLEMKSLSAISICYCPNFASFLEGGGLHAPNLTQLTVKGSKKLKKLPEQMHNLLPSLRSLEIQECPEMESFPEAGLPSNLTNLDVGNCPKVIAW